MTAAAEHEAVAMAAMLDRQDFAISILYSIRRAEMGVSSVALLPPVLGLCRRHRWRGPKYKLVAKESSAEVQSCERCDAMRGIDCGEGALGRYRYKVAMGASWARRVAGARA